MAVEPLVSEVPLQDVVARASSVIRELAERSLNLSSRGPLAGPVALAALGQVDQLVATLEVARSSLLSVASSHATSADLGGERNFASWRSRTTREGRARAESQIKLARVLDDVPGLREAVTDGAATPAHAEAVAQVFGKASEATRDRLVHLAQEIVDGARDVPVPTFRRQLEAKQAALEAEEMDHSYEASRARRYLRLTNRQGGVSIEGFLDAASGATLRTALDAVTPVPSRDDDRTAEQRGADALLLLAGRALTTGFDKVGAQVRPHLSVLVREDTWHLLLERRKLAAEGCTRPAHLTSAAFGQSGLEQEPPLAQLLDGTLLPFAALDLMACDAMVQRVVLDAAGSPINLGREERTYTKDARRAVLTRDRHCQWPGCALRATWSEVHHIIPWADQGTTDLANGITLCSNHHHIVHNRGVKITAKPGGFTFREQNGRWLGETTRLHDELLVPRPPGARSPDVRGPDSRTPDARIPEARSPDVRGPDSRTPDAGGAALPKSRQDLGAGSDDTVLPDDCPALLW